MSTEYARLLPRRWEGLARVFTALGDEHRQRILLMFRGDAELTIKEIAGRVPLSRTAVAHHLRVLRDAGVLVADKRGKEVHLRLAAGRVLDAIERLRVYVEDAFPSAGARR